MFHAICQFALFRNCTAQIRNFQFAQLFIKIQYPSIKSLLSMIVERSLYGAIVFAERHSHTVLSSVPSFFRSVFVPFSFRSACETQVSEISVNASFGSADDLQLLQMVSEGSRYKSSSFCIAARVYSDPESRLINYART